MNTPTPQQLSLIGNLIARFKSKSPKGYAILASICGISATIMGIYILMYQMGVLPKAYGPIEDKIEGICLVVGAALSALGLGAASTTTDPSLVSNQLKQNILDQAVQEGTHIPADEAEPKK